MENNSLKEYYIKLHKLYINAVNMLTAINQSLTTNASEVTIDIYEGNNTTSLKIPSFLYLDNKIEQIETTLSNLFNMPNSGEAWFSNDGNMHKLEMVRSTTAPLEPDLDITNITAGFSSNKFIKDLVNPRTYLKVNVTNLPSNINKMFMKKIVLLNTSLYTELSKLDITTYNEYKAALYNYKKGIDYEEYDSTLDLPIKQDKYSSSFKIESIIDNGTYTDDNNHIIYVLKLDTFEYNNTEDLSEVYSLKIGDHICVGNEYAIYKITDIDYTLMEVTIVEEVGHIALQPYSENSDMIFKLYSYDYSNYNYVEVPLEENQFIIVFLGTIYNGIRSLLSDGMKFDLSKIYMVNEDGSYIKDGYGNNITYLEYYNQYCNNIGDLILGLTQSAYPQLSNYNAYQLKQLQESDEIAKYVSETFNTEGLLTVLPINSHIYEENTIENIKSYHSQKTALQSELNSLTENINTLNNTLLTTDWSQETSTTQIDLQKKLQNFYSDRLTTEKQLNAVVNEISILTSENSVNANTKYRVRGVTNTTELEKYIKSITNKKIDVIGLEVEYKYKSISKQTSKVSNINNSIFSDWNLQNNIERQRKLIFNEATNGFTVEFVNYEASTNIIKWNQIDIPINTNEDVVIRIRYKYNIGQPFINIYSPWSDEVTVAFPTEYSDNVELSKIVALNDEDTVSTKFSNKLINDGYEEHIVNKLIANNQTFYHMPENIYSGFNTSENNLISLKDKLLSMCSDINIYKDLVDSENKKKLAVYLQYDSNSVELHSGITNSINIYNIDHISDYFVKLNMNIIIKNTGETPINLYSIFPGNIDVPLIKCNYDYYLNKLNDYYKLPIFVNNNIYAQTLGQWIYFRENNIYTGESVLYNSNIQIANDYKNINNIKYLSIGCGNEIFGTDNIQLGLPNIQRFTKNVIINNNTNISLGCITKDGVIYGVNDSNSNSDNIIDNDIYYSENNQMNTVIYKYEDITANLTENNTTIKLDKDTSITRFIYNTDITTISNNKLLTVSDFDGAFLYVNLNSNTEILTDGSEHGNKTIGVGESVSVPLVFEYFLSNKQTITKRIMFDIKNSLLTNPLNFVLDITANYDTSLEANINNVSNITGISDSATQ